MDDVLEREIGRPGPRGADPEHRGIDRLAQERGASARVGPAQRDVERAQRQPDRTAPRVVPVTPPAVAPQHAESEPRGAASAGAQRDPGGAPAQQPSGEQGRLAAARRSCARSRSRTVTRLPPPHRRLLPTPACIAAARRASPAPEMWRTPRHRNAPA